MRPDSWSTLRWGLVATAIAVAFVVGLLVGIRLGQPSFRLSPTGTAEVILGDVHVAIAYSRPYARGRTIFGELVPWGEVWRTGANEATSLVTDGDLLIGDAAVPAGEYTLYTIPEPTGWTLIVSRETGQWGTVYNPERDRARIPMRSEALPELVEQLTLRFETPEVSPQAVAEEVAQETAQEIAQETAEEAPDEDREAPEEALLVLEWERIRATVPIRAIR
ncbi:MAG TPA: DUF2911 domain-containing protein [Thermoanaerobaculia bacterium]|nr:DUF2911 domain-containing protein [Thermoanaerobaculia bacterium]